MNFNLRKTKKQKGYTLIEMLISFGVISMLIVGIFMMYTKVQNSRISNQESQNLATLTVGIKNLYQARPNFTGLAPAVLLQAQVVPENMINGANIVNSWTQVVAVAPVAFNGIANAGFSITYLGVPQSACVNLATKAGANYDIVSVGGTAVKAVGVPDIDVPTVTGLCNTGAANNTLVFTGSR
jgi:type II secretory pathway pseudopilin PulG